MVTMRASGHKKKTAKKLSRVTAATTIGMPSKTRPVRNRSRPGARRSGLARRVGPGLGRVLVVTALSDCEFRPGFNPLFAVVLDAYPGHREALIGHGGTLDPRLWQFNV